MSKRDDDSQADMEVGMTTAERRRRRRRGGGLRVPSDNVPRRTTPPVVAPVPEDPSLAMSIAYSFDSSEARAANGPGGADPVAPDAMTTVIDPPTPSSGNEDFEMKTREMSAVDLEALGLTGLDSSAGDAASSLPGMAAAGEVKFKKTLETPVPAVDELGDGGTTLDTEDPDVEISDDDSPPAATAAPPEPEREPKSRERLKTVALSDDDLEEVREAVRASGAQEPAKAPISQPIPVATPPAESAANRTQPLSALDIEVIKTEPPPPAIARAQSEEVMSVPDIDIQELAERASDTSGEYEVDINEADDDAPATAAASAEPARSTGTPAPQTPPPPPPAHAKAPPAPPPAAKKEKPAPPPKAEPKRMKAWFTDLFDEDYLRTLPFLTPQATQAEAEFVIDTMQLAASAQVLDVGCGYGRHAMELAARGFHVVGLDLSTPLLVRGGEEAMRRGLQINFVRGDMRELDFDAQFDGAYCLFSTFGYFDDETNKKTLGNIARALKPGGKVVIEILNRDYVIADLPTRVWWEGDGCVVLEEVELNYFSSRIQVNRSVVFDDGRQLEQEISVRAYSLHEVGKLMHAAGFRVLEVSGGYQTRGRFFGNQSRHIIVLAERKDTSA